MYINNIGLKLLYFQRMQCFSIREIVRAMVSLLMAVLPIIMSLNDMVLDAEVPTRAQ
jgi:hypothetical protein